MNSPDPAIVAYVQRRLYRSRHRDAERHTLARREAARIRANAYERMTFPPDPDTARYADQSARARAIRAAAGLDR